jgi:hypothetical protein
MTGHVRSVAAAVRHGTIGFATGASGRSQDQRVRSSPRETVKHTKSIGRGDASGHDRPDASGPCGCSLEMTGRYHCGVRFVKRARPVKVSRARAVRDLRVRSWTLACSVALDRRRVAGDR